MKEIKVPPFAPILMESTRAIGYSLETAIADVIDNSITAKATTVSVAFFPIDGEYISILDNGIGMNERTITSAMRYGSKDPTSTRNVADLGRFGLGLKTASLSQCRKLTVISKINSDIEGRQWDLDHVIRTGEWSLKVLDRDEMQGFPQYDQLLEQSSGTLVVWQDLDRMKIGELNFANSMSHKMTDVRNHLSLVYHRFLEGGRGRKKLHIVLNGVELVPQDPFLTDKSERPMADETLRVHGAKVLVRPYILPHPSKMTEEELESLGGKEGLRKKQGFYIYRGRRLVIWGTWFKMARQGELSKLVRIQVDVPNSLDDLWTLDIKKSAAMPPEEVKQSLRSVVEKLMNTSKRTYTYRGKKETADDVQHIWNRLKTPSGGYLYEINRSYPLIGQLTQAHPDMQQSIECLLRQIENGIPLNSLYVDLTNDIKIQNDTELTTENLLDQMREILKTVDPAIHEMLVQKMVLSEPFNVCADQIYEAYKRGELS